MNPRRQRREDASRGTDVWECGRAAQTPAGQGGGVGHKGLGRQPPGGEGAERGTGGEFRKWVYDLLGAGRVRLLPPFISLPARLTVGSDAGLRPPEVWWGTQMSLHPSQQRRVPRAACRVPCATDPARVRLKCTCMWPNSMTSLRWGSQSFCS